MKNFILYNIKNNKLKNNIKEDKKKKENIIIKSFQEMQKPFDFQKKSNGFF